MSNIKQNLVIHYDEKKQTLVCYSTDATHTRKIREQGIGVEIPLLTHMKISGQEIERALGIEVLNLLNLPVKLHAKDRQKKNGPDPEYMEALEKAAWQGNPESQFSLAIEYFTEGVRNGSAQDIEYAEIWLKKAAENGCKDAIDYLNNHWATDKSFALRGIADANGETVL